MMAIERYVESHPGRVESAVRGDKPAVVSASITGVQLGRVFSDTLQRSRNRDPGESTRGRSSGPAPANPHRRDGPPPGEMSPRSPAKNNGTGVKPAGKDSVLSHFPAFWSDKVGAERVSARRLPEKLQADNALRSARAQELRALIERCVKLASIGESESGWGDIHIILSEALFADAEFILRRNDQAQAGEWDLSIVSDCGESRRLLEEAAAALREQFSERRLGDIRISVEPVIDTPRVV